MHLAIKIYQTMGLNGWRSLDTIVEDRIDTEGCLVGLMTLGPFYFFYSWKVAM